jgi:hypothetical protein
VAEDLIERDAKRTARSAVGIATERIANGFGTGAVLNRNRECDGRRRARWCRPPN